MTAASQDRAFIESVIPAQILEDCIGWISDKMSPEDVFSTAELGQWAEDNGYVTEEV
jgi:hypothetical protein